MGMSCVIIVSLDDEIAEDGGKASEVSGRWASRVVTMVMQRLGMLSFFVRRIDAVVAWYAERRARRRGCRGTSRFMVLFGVADWIV